VYSKRSSRPAFYSRIENLAGFELIAAGVVAAEKKYVFRGRRASTSLTKKSKVNASPQEVVYGREEVYRKREVPKEVREEEGSKEEELRRGRVIRGALIESSSSHPLLWAYERLESRARKKSFD
jgi:hypothetical protein